jgi:hypothetical protein
MQLHHRAKAKNVIFCFMDGGPSHVDTFDPKPMLKKHEGKAIGESAVSKRARSRTPGRVWMGSPWEFKQHGQSGLWVSELFPHIAQVADKLCVVRSMVGELPLHGQQNLLAAHGSHSRPGTEFGRVGVVWTRHGEQEPTRLCRAQQRLGAQWRSGKLRQLFSPRQSSGDHVPRQRRSGR